MKNNFKKIIALFFAATLLFLGACSNNPKDDVTAETKTVEVEVDKFTAEYIFSDNGLITKEKKYYDNVEKQYEYYEVYEYNDNNQITKRYATDLDGNVLEKHDVFEISYAENGNIEMISENGTNYVFEYANENLVKYTKIKNSVVLAVNSFEYDENGNKTKEIKENKENNSTKTIVYAYNENGLLTSETTNSNDSSTYEYNAEGLVSKLTRTTENETRTIEYKYQDGLLTEETMTVASANGSADRQERNYTTTYEYLEDGKIVKFSRERNGEIYKTDSYSADEAKGNFAEFENIISL